MSRARRRKSEEGSLLIILMIGVAVSSIALGVAMQSWSVTWRRDSEEELIFRGNEYVDAILAYRKEHGGQFPTNLETLFEPGPRRLRYIRRLYRDPIAKDGKWGLLYLMPGGQGVYDPGAAERQAASGGSSWNASGLPGLGGRPGGANLAGGTGLGSGIMQPGVTAINTDPTGTGVANPAGMVPGALPPGTALPTPPKSGWGDDDEDSESISEQPLGWPIVGVVSRASGERAENTYKIYKGHERVNEWQFHVFDRGIQLQQPPAAGAGAVGARPGFVGPGFGGKGKVSGMGVRPGRPTSPWSNLPMLGGGRGARPGGGRSLVPPGTKRGSPRQDPNEQKVDK